MSDKKQETDKKETELESRVRQLQEHHTSTVEDMHTVCADITACEEKLRLLHDKLDKGLRPLLQRQKEQLALHTTLLGFKNEDKEITSCAHTFSIDWLDTAKTLVSSLSNDQKTMPVRIVCTEGLTCRWPMWRDPELDLHLDFPAWRPFFLDYYYSIPEDDLACYFYSAAHKTEFDNQYPDTSKCVRRPYFFLSQGILSKNDYISEDNTRIHFEKSSGRLSKNVESVMLRDCDCLTEISLFERDQIFLLLSPDYPFNL